MAILDFPASPTIGQTYTANGSTWTWDGAYSGYCPVQPEILPLPW